MFFVKKRFYLQCLRVTSWTCIALLAIGYYSNKLVIWANGGTMPVAMEKEDVLFVIGPADAGVKFFFSAGELAKDHQPLTEHARFRILADRIPISFTIIEPFRLPHWLLALLHLSETPIEREGITSIGDLLLWTGRWLALLLSPILLRLFFWTIFCRLLRKNRAPVG